MKILVNGTTLVIGGGIQVARALVLEFCKESRGHVLKFVMSPQLAEVLPGNIDTIVLSPSPARILSGREIRRKLSLLEKDFRPDVVLTVFGPAYWRPKALHICGYANAWTFTANRYAWANRDQGIHSIIGHIKCLYKKYEIIRENPKAFVVETSAVADAIKRQLKRDAVFVVNNNYGQSFLGGNREEVMGSRSILPKKRIGEFRIVTLSQYYSHKNLELIPEVAKVLQDNGYCSDFRFYLSLDKASPGWQKIKSIADRLGVSDMVITTQPILPQYAPLFYSEADTMFLPTLLECFSANYPEAMIMGVPIVTTDLPFARDVCQNAALYFKPFNARDAAARILEIHNKKDLQKQLIEKGFQRVTKFPSPQEKARQYLEICESVFDKYG